MRFRAPMLMLLIAAAAHCASRAHTQAPAPPPVSAPSTEKDSLHAVAIAAGLHHACALTAEDKVLCWGENGSGQLGDGTREAHKHPTEVKSLGAADLVIAGGEHTCARKKSDQSLVCWGQNAHGELGDGTTEERLLPAAVADLHAVLSAGAGGHMTCARKANRFVVCWGEMQEGATVKEPTPIFGMTETEELAVGAHHACARFKAESGIENVRCWGANGLRQLGVPRAAARGLPVVVPHLDGVAQLSLGVDQGCARTEQGLAVCWGGGLRCVPGDWFDGKRVAVKPGAIPGMERAALVAAGGDQACTVRNDGGVACARERDDAAATGNRSCISEPVAGLSSVTSLALGDGFGCALKGDGTVWCWEGHGEPTQVR